MSNFDNVMAVIEMSAELKGSFVTPNFGDKWQAYTQKTIDESEHPGNTVKELIHMAWIQGRKAILLEEALKLQMELAANRKIVLPEKKEEGEWHQSYNDGKKAGYNECINEVKRLNKVT